jgi:hypothetical protein
VKAAESPNKRLQGAAALPSSNAKHERKLNEVSGGEGEAELAPERDIEALAEQCASTADVGRTKQRSGSKRTPGAPGAWPCGRVSRSELACTCLTRTSSERQQWSARPRSRAGLAAEALVAAVRSRRLWSVSFEIRAHLEHVGTDGMNLREGRNLARTTQEPVGPRPSRPGRAGTCSSFR